MPPKSPSKGAKNAAKGSPVKPTRLSDDPAPLPLPSLLKLLTTAGPRPPHLSMSQAIQLASKLVPKGYNSSAKLRTLTAVDLARIGVDDDDLRKAFMGILGKGGGGGRGAKSAADEGGEFKRRRPGRESDLDKPLPTRAPKETVVDEDYQFEEIEVEEALVQKTVLVNRAPVMTAWACVVAERLGFRRQEALSIAHCFTDLNATSKGVSLGLMAPDAAKVEVGPSQPFVDILGRKVPVLSTQHGEWRAISKGLVAEPAKAFAYIRGAFRQQLGAVIGAMRLLANSFSPAELNQKGYGLYLEFRPDVEGWGKKGEVKMSSILNLRRFLTHADTPPLPSPGPEAKPDEADAGRVVKVEQGDEAVEVAPGEVEGPRIKAEDGEAEDEEADQPARKKARHEEPSEEPKPPLAPAGKDDGDEFDEFDDGIDYGAIDL
ncbi:hypothetical protein JCM10207_004665 [Rhodosporidiobolus poonsookiae]